MIGKVFNNRFNNLGYKGFVTREMLERSFPKVSDDVLFLTCGPGPMN